MKEKVSKDLLKCEEKANEIKRLESKIIKLDEKMNLCYSEISWHSEHGTSEYHDREINDCVKIHYKLERIKIQCEKKLKKLKES